MDLSKAFLNQPVVIPIDSGGLSLSLEFYGLSCNVFYIFTSLLSPPPNKLLINMLQSKEVDWIALRGYCDPSSAWVDSVLAYLITLAGHQDQHQAILGEVKKNYSDDFLFKTLALQNAIGLYFDSLIDPAKEAKDEKETEETDSVKGILYLNMVCNKLGITELNGKKININNIFDTLTFAQYCYLTQSESVIDLIILSNLSYSPFGGEIKKEKRKTNIETHWGALKNIINCFCKEDGTPYPEAEWFEDELRQKVKGRNQSVYSAIYDYFDKPQ